MVSDETYSLKWGKFESAAMETLKSLHSNEDFADVTLACQDDHQIKSHKVILAAASPFFQRSKYDMFSNNFSKSNMKQDFSA